jgi:VWFA-related protein
MKASVSSARRKTILHSLRAYGIILILPILLASVTAQPATSSQGTSVRVESFTLRPDGQVRIENARGSTNVMTWESQTVRVVAEKKSPPGSILNPSEMVLMGAQNTVLVQCKQTGAQGRIDLMVYVPRRTQLQLVGGSWPVDVGGSLASAVIETTGGNIEYRVPKTDDARIVMQSARGTVRSTAPIKVAQKTGNKGLQGTLGQGGSPIFLSSHTGHITLSESNDLPAVASLSGEIPSTAQDEDQAASNRQGGGTPASSRPSVTGRDSQSDQDANSIAIPPSQRASRQPNQPPAQPSSGGGGSVVFAGDNSDGEDSQTDRVGPLSGARRENKQTGGNMGLSVRIIPSGETLNSNRRQTPSPYDDDQGNQSQRDNTQGGVGGSTGTQTSKSGGIGGSRTTGGQDSNGSYDPRPSRSYPQPDTRRGVERQPPEDEDSSSVFPKPGAPPVLRRNTDKDDAESNGGAGPQPEDDAIVLNSSLVSLNVSVTNRSGSALANLSKGDFDVFENGELQKIEFFAPSSAPFNLVLVLDLSGSIQDKLNLVKSAASKFLDVIGTNDKVAVLTFTDQVRVVSPLSSNRDLVRKRIKTIDQATGGTAFYEAMWFAIVDTLRGTQGQRNAVVVMTDGVDSSLDRFDPLPSRVSYNQLARRLEESDALVFPIYLDTEFDEVFKGGRSSSESYAIARMQLERLAEITGGQSFRAETADDLSGVYKQVAAAIRTIYSVGYYPIRSERDGSFHRVRVAVNRPDAAVRTRRGYYAK